ncbi:ATP-grasp domain-containing protein [Propionibacteriaceae bacterium Y1923]|uniref:ATP-grasp domain-containing protein n=1 Tax=Aestuariimicrobium sp. Y1814 TaxID=3418742 RepID=UPI003C1A44E4
MAINFVCISPGFPETNEHFCRHLAGAGVRVLGIGDSDYHELSEGLRGDLAEYYRVDNLEDYAQVHKATAFLTFRHGQIGWVESFNEYWLETDARLRTDFNVTSGHKLDLLPAIKSKRAMKPVYARAGVPTARQIEVTTVAAAQEFTSEVGFPVIVKPEVGVGATSTQRIDDEDDLVAFFGQVPAGRFVMEEFLEGDIYSFDAILDAEGEPVFEAATRWPPSIMNVVLQGLDLTYRVLDEVPAQLRERGRATAKAFGMRNRFVHLEFFKLDRARPGLAEQGEFVGLEVNMRPAGGFTLDMLNHARSADVYQIYTDLVTGRDTGAAAKAAVDPKICVYAGRRDLRRYRYSRDELLARYEGAFIRHRRNPAMMVPQMGDEFFLLRADSEAAADEFVADALALAGDVA